MGETEPGEETSLSEVMLIFQAGGERTTVPRWDSSSYLGIWRAGSFGESCQSVVGSLFLFFKVERKGCTS